jgi:hypothetical protein
VADDLFLVPVLLFPASSGSFSFYEIFMKSLVNSYELMRGIRQTFEWNQMQKSSLNPIFVGRRTPAKHFRFLLEDQFTKEQCFCLNEI